MVLFILYHWFLLYLDHFCWVVEIIWWLLHHVLMDLIVAEIGCIKSSISTGIILSGITILYFLDSFPFGHLPRQHFFNWIYGLVNDCWSMPLASLGHSSEIYVGFCLCFVFLTYLYILKNSQKQQAYD